MRKILFVTSRFDDVRELAYRSRTIWSVTAAHDISAVCHQAASAPFDFILLDIGLTGAYGPDVLKQLSAQQNHPPLFILSREYCFYFYDLAYRSGVCGYFHIPYSFSMLALRIERFFEAATFASIEKTAGSAESLLAETILGKSGLMTKLRESILALQNRTEPVIISGETGCGKDLVARMIHEHSPVASGPFKVLNVSCIPNSLAESLLFGTVRGCYTDATDRKGLFEAAEGGTLFLDEIGELDLMLQPKFLRVLEEQKVTPIGSSCSRFVNFRLLCATNRNMHEAVGSGKFREDLFYRLDILRIQIPPLRSHPEDIPLLASSLLQKYRKVLSSHALEKLGGYYWPGNVRQLFNCLTRAACTSGSDVIYPDQILF